MGPRRLLKEGLLLKAKSGRRLRGFLCSDIMVLTDEAGKTLYRMVCFYLDVLPSPYSSAVQPIPLTDVQVKEVAGGRGRRPHLIMTIALMQPDGFRNDLDDMAFEISLAYPRGGDKVVLRATSVRDCQVWVRAIASASRKCREAHKRASRKVSSGP
jgi:actin cytoskeleton-regulatory complex protein PAN1